MVEIAVNTSEIIEIKAGDLEDFTNVWAEQSPLLERFIQRIYPSADHEDILQLVAIKLWRKGLRINSTGPNSVRNYLISMIKSTAKDSFRHKAIRHTAPLELAINIAANTPDPYDCVPRELDSDEAISTIDLSDQAIQTFYAHHVHGFSYEELAAQDEQKVGTIKSRISRGKAKVMREWEIELDEE